MTALCIRDRINPMAGTNGGDKNLAAGLKLLHEEMKGVRSDIAASLRDSAEDRRRADEDRRRADGRFEFLLETIREERKQSDRQMRVLVRSGVQIGQRIIGKLDEQGKKLDQHSRKLDEQTGLLKAIQKGMNGHPRGRNGNGPSRS